MSDEPTTLEAWLEKLRAVPCVTVEIDGPKIMVSVPAEVFGGVQNRGGLVRLDECETELQRVRAGKKLSRAVGRTLHDHALDRERWRQYFPLQFADLDALEKTRDEDQ